MTHNVTQKTNKHRSLDFNHGNPSLPADAFSLKISSQRLTRGAGGRDEAFSTLMTSRHQNDLSNPLFGPHFAANLVPN